MAGHMVRRTRALSLGGADWAKKARRGSDGARDCTPGRVRLVGGVTGELRA